METGEHHVSSLTIYTLGRFAVYRGDELIEDAAWKRRKAKTLFKLLLLAPNRRLLKNRVLEWLWPDHAPDSAANNLHRTVFVLRRILQPGLDNAADSAYLFFEHGALCLNPDTIASVDSEEFERQIQLGRKQGDALSHYETARSLYQGDFLPEDRYEDWARDRRWALRTSYCSLLQHMARLYVQRNAVTEAIDCLHDLLSVEPTHEEAYRELMRIYTLAGHRHRALHLYHRARRMLQQELEVEPSPETAALYRAIAENRWQPAPETASLLRPLTASSRSEPPHGRSPLVGREAELRTLKEILHRTQAGHGGIVILSGEQGIGKTRLAEEIMGHARDAGIQVLYGAAYEQEGRLPYGPFVEVIRAALADRPMWSIREGLGATINDLARLLPELASAPVDLPPPTRLEVEISQERQRVFDAVTATFMLIARDSPLLVFLDDFHAADESSLQLLHYLARRIFDAPILVLCAVREEEAPQGTPIARLLRELLSQHLGRQLNLSPMAPRDVGRLAAELLDGRAITRELCVSLYKLSEGNPFFVQEIVLALVETERIEKVDGRWHLAEDEALIVPTSILEVISLRLERLSRDAFQLAAFAAVIGRECSYELLEAGIQQSSIRWDDAALLDLLDELLGARLVEEMPVGYRFRHGLIRQVLYDELTAHRRGWLHEQVAQALEEMEGHQLDERAAILAHHYERAERPKAALRYLIRAGDRAQATYAPQEAVDHYDRALALCQEHPELATAETIANVRARRAQAYLTVSDFDAAIGDLEKLLETSRRTRDRFREGEALYQLGIAHYWAHRLKRAAAYLDQAIQLAETLHYDDLCAKALKLRDMLDSTRGDVAQSAPADESTATEQDHRLPPEEHWGRAMLAHLRSDFEVALRHAQACIELGRSSFNTFLELGGYFVVGMTHASLGHYQLALDHLLQALDLTEAAGDRFWRARLLNTVGWVYRELFDLQCAVRYDQASLDLARAGKPRLTEAEGNALANLAADYFALQEYDEARTYLEQGLRSAQDDPFMRWRYWTRMVIIKGRLALVAGDVTAALESADESLVVAQSTQARKNVSRSCRLRGEALLAAGRVDEARAALRHALDVSRQLKSPGLVWPCYVAMATLEEAEGRHEVAKTHYSSAAEICLQMADGLTDEELRQRFLNAEPVQHVLVSAVLPAMASS